MTLAAVLTALLALTVAVFLIVGVTLKKSAEQSAEEVHRRIKNQHASITTILGRGALVQVDGVVGDVADGWVGVQSTKGAEAVAIGDIREIRQHGKQLGKW